LLSELQRVPGVVLVAGSGPTDRDGNNSMIPVRIDSLKQIAERLAAARIATLRFDKRGIAASGPPPTTAAGLESFYTWPNLVGDVQAAHAELLRHDEIKPYATALLGHSEGGALALAAAAAMRKPPYALVLASTFGLTMEETIHRQLVKLLPAEVAAADRVMTAVRRDGRVPADVPAALASVFPSYMGPYLKDALAFDPAQALAASPLACLLVHGGADQQIVPPQDIQPLLDVLGKRSAPGEVLVVPGVSHNLKKVAGAGDPGFAGPLATEIGDKLASWLGFVLGA
jgi:alpha-beta hydrolase superfamily lysophospholipase